MLMNLPRVVSDRCLNTLPPARNREMLDKPLGDNLARAGFVVMRKQAAVCYGKYATRFG